MTTVSMPTLTAAFLVAGHVDDLWNAWANDKEAPGCCTECCAPCSALKTLFDADQLDELYGAYMDHVGGESDTWDAGKRQVGRAWLLEAWAADLGCGPHCNGTDDRPCSCGDPDCPWNAAADE